MTIITMVAFLFAIIWPPQTASANVFDELGAGLATVSGLRGVVRGLASGAGEGLRDELNKFIDEKVDPLVSRVDKILEERIEQATQGALVTIRTLESSLNQIIDRAATRAHELNAAFFAQLSENLDRTFARLEALLDSTLCRVMPDGRVEISLGPFSGNDEITVKWPRRTHCYSRFLGAREDPSSAVFRRWEYFAGELCEYELKLNRIDPTSPTSMGETAAGYDKLSEMANTARCAAPTPAAKAEMAQKLYLYQNRAAFFRRLQQRDVQ
ncbi:hypothetical protein WMF11_03885 [Sorangium sp. So ce295]|uniref:hypothetical protein n=1 Tax=Sorangium sp. So ce295 TaxID=3133295 RepID=UPI003F641B49